MDDTTNYETIKSEKESLSDLLAEMEELYNKMGELLIKYHEIIGGDDGATVKSRTHVKRLLDKYSELK